MVTYMWIILLGIREAVNIYSLSTTLLTMLITCIQVLDLFLLLIKQIWRITWYHMLLSVLILIVLFNSNTLATVNILLSVILLKGKKIKKICLVICSAYLIGIFAWSAGYLLGFLEDTTKIYNKGLTHTLGFKNSNTMGLIYLQMVLVYGTTCLIITKNRFLPLLLLLPEYFIFKYTLSRTSLISICLFLFLLLYFSKYRKYKFIKRVMFTIPVFLFILVYFVSYSIKFSYPLYAAANVFMTGRPRMVYNILQLMRPINFILGYKLEEGALDCAYLGILLSGGVFSLILFFSCTIKGMKNMDTQAVRFYFPFIFTILLAGVSEGIFSLFRLSTILFYKILTDQFEFSFIKSKYIGVYNG